MDFLQIKHINKNFGSLKALDDISLTIKKGTIYGLLGPNGAGKTTLLRIINSILLPDSGKISFLGKSSKRDISGMIGYMPEERGLYEKMRVEDQILYFGQLKGGQKERLKKTMNELLRIFNLSGQNNRRIKELSKGNQQKVQIISTLVHEPELVILDEPFSGFDPINGQILQEVIGRLKDKGTTLILSSHNMSAIEGMCSDIALLNAGRLLVNDTIENIKDSIKVNTLLLTTRSELNYNAVMESGIINSVEKIDNRYGRKGFSYRLRKNPGIKNREILELISPEAEITHFEEELPSLTDIFLKYTSRSCQSFD